MQPGGADSLPLVGPGVITELQLSKTKTHYERKTTQWGGADSLPLVGRGTSEEFQLLKPAIPYEGRPVQSGGAGCLPLVGHGTQNPIRKETPAGGVASLPPPGSLFNEKMLTPQKRVPNRPGDFAA
jgi:hypothetical protein